MIFGDVVNVVEDGIQLARSAVQRIGIYDGSICWGVWVRDPRPEGGGRMPHLLVSPIHPGVWPYLLRCEIKLGHNRGSMAEAARLLVANDIDIQFGECTPSGHHHATWNIVAEAVAVRRDLLDDYEKTQKLRHDEKTQNNETIRQFANELAERMLRLETGLADVLIDAHQAECPNPAQTDSGFLHNRIVSKDALFYDPEKMSAAIQEIARASLPKAVTCRWMQNLAFFSIYGQIQSATRFQYDASTSTLRLADRGGMSRVLQQVRPDGRVTEYIPSQVHLSIDTTEQSMRIELVKGSTVRHHYMQASIMYRSQFLEPGNGGTGADAGVPASAEGSSTTLGLWHSICHEVAEVGVDLIRISNRITDQDATTENGEIKLIGKAERVVDRSWFVDLEGCLEKNCASEEFACDVSARVGHLPHRRVFVSLREMMPHRKTVLGILGDHAVKWGMELTFGDLSPGMSIPEGVEKRVRSSDGVFQLISLSAEESDKHRNGVDVEPDLGWLLYEYGLAAGLELPSVRMLDLSDWDRRQWNQSLRIGLDDTLPGYRIEPDRWHIIEKEIGDAVEGLAREIARRRR